MKNQKGFTLAELLIVMAIIVVLAAVAIPTFGKQLETSRETSDMEIIRNAYTEALTYAIQDGSDGLFDGKIGDLDANTDRTTAGIKYAAPTGVTDGQSGSYEVTIATAIPGGKFSQNGAQAAGGENESKDEGTWAYVSNKFLGLTVPPVNVKNTKLTFQFKFNAEGEVVPDGVKVKINKTETPNCLFTPA